MASNIEIKARVRDLGELKQRAEAISNTSCTVLLQEDTFFNTPNGRLKLRKFSDGEGELIHYVRPDDSGPKRSDYQIAATDVPDKLRAVLAAAWGVRGVVRKRRSLYHAGQTRIHLDEVDGLGTFVELEVVLSNGQDDRHGQAVAAQLMAQLGIMESDLIDRAYVDLLPTGE